MGERLRVKLSARAQISVPRRVRERLGLRGGDTIEIELDDDRLILRRVPATGDDPFATFTEWAGDADERAYGEL